MNPFLNILPRPAQLSLGALALGLALACAGLSVQPVLAQETHLTITPGAYGATKRIELELNKTMLVDLPAGAAEVVVSQPSIAAAIMRTRTRALVQGIEGGDTNIFFLDDAGRTIAVLDVKVIKEPSQVGNALEATLARIIPGSHIKVESVTLVGEVNRVVMTGTVLSGDDKDKASLVAEQFAGGIGNVANIIEVAGTQQVMLQVTVSEVKRDVAKQFGINLSGTLSVGSTKLSFNNATTTGTNGAAGTFGLGDLQINAAIRALETRGALRILAQPTLTAISGQPAKFLAGGELPYATIDPTTQQRTVIFKPYGVELAFTPVVKSNGTISLTVDTSVSDPQSDGSLTKRQANTSVELAAGTTLAIGGLLQETTRQQINQLPGLGNIPILGALFRSRDFQTQQTELVILVTPFLVQPSPANTIPVPTDGAAVASDAEAIFLGRMENMYGVAGSGEIRGSIKGSVGFVLD